jgi:hypothetical protein
VAVGLRGVVQKGLIGRRRRRIPLNQSEKEMIVKTRRRSKMNQKREIGDHCLLRVLALLPSASSEARRRLRRRTILLWDVHCLERRRTEIGKDSRAKRLGGELGAPTVSFIGLARQIVASSFGSGSWRISRENRKVERFP